MKRLTPQRPAASETTAGETDSTEAGGTDTTEAAGAATTEGSTDTVDASQGTDLTFHMITHSDSGPFWSVVKRGMEAAAEDLGVTLCGSSRSTTRQSRCS